MRPRFLVVLTSVRADDTERDERNHPERTVEAIAVTGRAAAEAVFRAMCALPAVRAGQQRVKVVDLAGGDTWNPHGWVAPLLTTATRRALIRIGARRRGAWHLGLS